MLYIFTYVLHCYYIDIYFSTIVLYVKFVVYGSLLAQLLSARYRCERSGVRFPGRSNRHSVANGSPSFRCFFGAVLPRRYAAIIGSAACYRLRRITASTMLMFFARKILIGVEIAQSLE